ncbi:hypothetical protein SBA3_1380016 [Candidatus Sulfopaludibacter sp. SbA3]|nr:hypothetical protein SBA3_1380016 [Candidatus Sulfopaludibacter sp. SbA3]
MHRWNIVLERVALHRGNLGQAADYLLAAGRCQAVDGADKGRQSARSEQI